MKLVLIIAMLFFANMASAGNAVHGAACNIKECPAGTKVISAFSKNNPYYSCPTEALSNYVNLVVGYVSVYVMKTNYSKMPNISPLNGEPEAPPIIAADIAELRLKAGVTNFPQAMQQCKVGKNNEVYTVANFPSSSTSMWVAPKNGDNTWIPKVFLDLKK